MPKELSIEEIYDKCLIDGIIIPQNEVEIDKIESMIKIAEQTLESGKLVFKNKLWSPGYNLYYDVLHILVDAFLRFEKIKSNNHQCLFAYLCIKHPELELDWNFFEKIRTKRNGINYYGTPVNEKDWKDVEIQFNLYIAVLKNEIIKKIESNN